MSKPTDNLRKLGILRGGSAKGTFTSAKDKSDELTFDRVYDAKKDQVHKEDVENVKAAMKTATGSKSIPPVIKKLLGNKKRLFIWGGAAIVALILLVTVFGSPSAASVFKDMNETMLRTKSVTVNQKYKGGGGDESIDLDSTVSMDLSSNKELAAKGDFTLNLTSGGTPMTVMADFIAIGENSYVKYSKLSSPNPELADSFSQVESKLKGNWIKSRGVDQFSSFAKIPVDSLANILPTPFANLNDDQRKNVLTILQDKSTYTIGESSKVEINGVSAYKYVISYNKDQYNKVAKVISEYVDYFKSNSSDESEIKTLTVWVNIGTKRIIKMEFEGTAELGSIEGLISFSGYNETVGVEKPSDYSIESELLD